MAGIRVTWRDVQSMPEDGKRYEAIDGEMYVTPAPRTRHQWVTVSLLRELLPVLGNRGRLFTAPVGVEFTATEEGVQPDVLFVRTERLNIVREDTIQGAPDLVIEILSPSTARRDRSIKLQLYRRQGVAEYWIVDTDARQVEVWRLADGASEPDRYTDVTPVMLERHLLGSVELARVFDWPV
ncbi:MAG: Uma2 family endonuclease [Gemmatimonadetes bacterium]|nr:Uma2 family endonuclease [Gemmatimonadota bacterium]